MNGTVLAYHAVGVCPLERDPHQLFIQTERFAEQMEFLDKHRHIVSLKEIVTAPARGKVAITFDDAYRNLLEDALPLLARLGFPSTIFVPTAFIGDTNAWLEPTPADLRIMNRDELLEASRFGAELESHGHAHLDMAKATFDEVAGDLARASDVLTTITGRPPMFLAYPFGSVERQAEQAAAASGLRAAFTIDARHQGRFQFGRVPATRWDGLRVFRLKTSGHWLQVRRSRLGEMGASALGWGFRPRKRLGDITGRYHD